VWESLWTGRNFRKILRILSVRIVDDLFGAMALQIIVPTVFFLNMSTLILEIGPAVAVA
jgi:hypothetical protein